MTDGQTEVCERAEPMVSVSASVLKWLASRARDANALMEMGNLLAACRIMQEVEQELWCEAGEGPK